MPKGYVCEQRYGVVLFDDPGQVESGWACIAEGSPFYITSIHDLFFDVIWHTNVDIVIFNQKGLFQNTSLRCDSYLRTGLSSIVVELGLNSSSVDNQVRILADLFSTTMQFYLLHTGSERVPIGSLNNGVRQICIPEEQPISNVVREAATAAVHTHILSEKRQFKKGSNLVSFVFHRFLYSKEILTENLPVGPWERISPANLRASKHYLPEFISDLKKPALIKVVIHSLNENIGHFVNFGIVVGAPINNSSPVFEAVSIKQRTWMTSIEYLKLCKYADMQIEDIYIAQGYGHSPITVPSWGRYTENSYAFGLYCENIWTALTRSLDGCLARTPLSAWVHSIDRLKCLSKAIAIDSCEDVTVHSYGFGRITLQVNNSEHSRVSRIAERHKLLASMSKPTEIRVRSVTVGASHTELMQVAMERGSIDFIERTNAVALNSAIELYDQYVFNNSSKNILSM